MKPSATPQTSDPDLNPTPTPTPPRLNTRPHSSATGRRSTSSGHAEGKGPLAATNGHTLQITKSPPVPTSFEGRRRLSTDVSSFSALSSAITSDADVNVVSDITFTGVITISGKTNVKISSSTGAVLSSARTFSNSYGGMFNILSLSDVTFTGLGFASGSASYRGGCFYVDGSSTVEVEDVDFTSCSAAVRQANKPHRTKPNIRHRHHPTHLPATA